MIAADATSHDHAVFLPRRINASYILQACNRAGCTDSAPIAVSGNLAAAAGYMKAPNANANDEFGYSVALAADGSTLAVGAHREDSNATGVNGNQGNNSATDSGAVYVFSRSGNTWNQQAYIKASNAEGGDLFGYSVALGTDGSTLAVGAPSEDGSASGINNNPADNAAPDSGAVYVFTRSGGAWSQQAYVKASNTGSGDWFGVSVGLAGDGNTLAVGAYNEGSNAVGLNGDQNNNSAFDSGAAYVFTRSGGTWSQQAYVKASNTNEGDAFGISVALAADGNTLVVGAAGEDSSAIGINGGQASNAATDSGAVYVFTRSGATWSQRAYVKASNTNARNLFGYSMALAGDGSTLAVGANMEAGSGAVYLY
ncbi:MAG TPA: hypothetical protein DHV59_09985 [Oxalobacteraceae bacterium]|nr:hypothetical protein [Oxalobacteraceae bacterium]